MVTEIWPPSETCLRGFSLPATRDSHGGPCPQRLALLAVFVSTFIFSLTWQFNQFAMLLQALGLFALDSLDMLPALKVSTAGRWALLPRKERGMWVSPLRRGCLQLTGTWCWGGRFEQPHWTTSTCILRIVR